MKGTENLRVNAKDHSKDQIAVSSINKPPFFILFFIISISLISNFSAAQNTQSTENQRLEFPKPCGTQGSTQEKQLDCKNKYGVEHTTKCYYEDEFQEQIQFNCNEWEFKKQSPYNIFKQALESYYIHKERVGRDTIYRGEATWAVIDYHVPSERSQNPIKEPVEPNPPPIYDRSCGLTGSEDEKIQNCYDKFGPNITSNCTTENFDADALSFNCANWNSYKNAGMNLTKQVMVTLQDWGKGRRPTAVWKMIDRYTSNSNVPNNPNVIRENYLKPQLPKVNCGLSGTIAERIENCKSTIEGVSRAYKSRVCYLYKINELEPVQKVSCDIENLLKTDKIPYQSWQLVSLDILGNRVWFDDINSKIWTSIEQETSNIFSAIRRCSRAKKPFTGNIGEPEVSFRMSSCSELNSAMRRGLKYLIPTETSKTQAIWCGYVDYLLKWDILSSSTVGSDNPFEDNSVVCSGHYKNPDNNKVVMNANNQSKDVGILNQLHFSQSSQFLSEE